MIDTFAFIPVSGSTVNMNTDPPGYPFEHYDVTVDDRVETGRNKMEEQGVWPTYPYVGGMSIHVEGKIMGTSSADYMTRRKALLAAFRSASRPTQRRHGSIHVRYTGESEDWACDVSVIAVSIPRGGLSPAMSEFAITFWSANPYFTGVTTPSNIYFDG